MSVQPSPLKIDAPVSASMRRIAAEAVRLEALGYDGLRVAELNHDPFLPLTLAAEHTERIELVTSVAVALSRNPMTMAVLAHDLNAFSNGRLVLGLGSQVKIPKVQIVYPDRKTRTLQDVPVNQVLKP